MARVKLIPLTVLHPFIEMSTHTFSLLERGYRVHTRISFRLRSGLTRWTSPKKATRGWSSTTPMCPGSKETDARKGRKGSVPPQRATHPPAHMTLAGVGEYRKVWTTQVGFLTSMLPFDSWARKTGRSFGPGLVTHPWHVVLCSPRQNKPNRNDSATRVARCYSGFLTILIITKYADSQQGNALLGFVEQEPAGSQRVCEQKGWLRASRVTVVLFPRSPAMVLNSGDSSPIAVLLAGAGITARALYKPSYHDTGPPKPRAIISSNVGLPSKQCPIFWHTVLV